MRRTVAVAAAAAAAAPGARAADRGALPLAGGAPFTYADPSMWHTGDNAHECRNHRQSPIHLKSGEAQEGSPGFLKLWTPRARSPEAVVTNTGNKIQLDVAHLGITLTGSHLWSQYTLMQMHYHAPSEHVIDGERYPLERQMVFYPSDHAALTESGQSRMPFAVIGELFKQDESRVADRMVQAMIDGGVTAALGAGQSINIPFQPRFDFAHDDIFTYEGSLTTPPCLEVVNWHVVRQPRVADQNQLQLLLSLIGGMPDVAVGGNPPPAPRYPMNQGGQGDIEEFKGDARPLQPTNGRPVVRRRFYATD